MALTGRITAGEKTTRTVIVDTDLSGKEYTAVAYDGTDERVVNALTTGAARGAGILLEGVDGTASGEQLSSIVTEGETYAKIGGSVVQGDLLMPTTGGKLIVATDGNYYIAKARGSGVDGDTIIAEVMFGYLETT